VIRSKTDPGARAEPAKKKKMELASTRRPILLSRFDDNIAKKAIQWTLSGHRGRQRPKAHGKEILR